MTEYLIQSRVFTPAYALVDDDKYPNQVVCYAEQDLGNKGHWKAIPLGHGDPKYYLQLADETEHRQAIGDPFTQGNSVTVGRPRTSWSIYPPLSEGDASTARTIATSLNDKLRVSEWTIHGDPNDLGIPKSLVHVQIRAFNGSVDPKSVWYFIPVN